MKYIDKNVESGIIRYTYDDYVYGFREIEYAFKDEDGTLNKFLSLNKDSDIRICGTDLNNISLHNMNFDILENDILYKVFIKFMSDDEIIKIESDDKREYNIKYVIFERLEEKVRIKIVNNCKNASSIDKFNCFIKNTQFDLRSKIDKDNLNYKKRLLELFDDIQELFEQEYSKGKVMEYKFN